MIVWWPLLIHSILKSDPPRGQPPVCHTLIGWAAHTWRRGVTNTGERHKINMADTGRSGDIRTALANPGGWKSLIVFFVLTLAWLVGFSSRLFAVIRFESIIHEFDPWWADFCACPPTLFCVWPAVSFDTCESQGSPQSNQLSGCYFYGDLYF